MNERLLAVLTFVYIPSWYLMPSAVRRSPSGQQNWVIGLQLLSLGFGFVAAGHLEFCAGMVFLTGCAAGISLFYYAPLIDFGGILADARCAIGIVLSAILVGLIYFPARSAAFEAAAFFVLFAASFSYWLCNTPEKMAAKMSAAATALMCVSMLLSGSFGGAVVFGGIAALASFRASSVGDQLSRQDCGQ